MARRDWYLCVRIVIRSSNIIRGFEYDIESLFHYNYDRLLLLFPRLSHLGIISFFTSLAERIRLECLRKTCIFAKK